MDPDESGVRFCAAELQRLKDESGDVEVANLAAVGDLLHLHEAVARRPPDLVGLRLLLQLTVEIRLTLLNCAGAFAAGTD